MSLSAPSFDSLPSRTEIAVVGAGLAGLTAARHLAKAGRDVLLLDPGSEPGGRVKTERVEDHALDLGFQVLLTGYPAVQEEIDLGSLQSCSLEPGCIIVRDGRHNSLPDPFRTPHRWLEAGLFPLATLGDKWKTRSLRQRLSHQTPEEIFAAPERMAAAALRDLGFSEKFLQTFWIPFFSAVFLDPPLEVTTRMFNFVFRSIAMGDIVLPRGGMGNVGRQIAAGLPPGCYHPLTYVTGLKIENKAVRGLKVSPAVDKPGPSTPVKEIAADKVILAATPEEARRLAGLEIPALEPLGVSVVYFSLEHKVTEEKRIFLNGGRGGPAHHCIFLSNICPDYAPPQRQLLSVTILGTPETEGQVLAERVRRQMEVWFPHGQVASWRWLATYKLPLAQFRQPPGLLSRLPGAVTRVPGVYLAGDYTRHSSLQGALESGQIAARAILEG